MRNISEKVAGHHLPAGGADPQSPHMEEEVYYITSGKAMIRVADEDWPVQAGSVVYAAKIVVHRRWPVVE